MEAASASARPVILQQGTGPNILIRQAAIGTTSGSSAHSRYAAPTSHDVVGHPGTTTPIIDGKDNSQRAPKRQPTRLVRADCAKVCVLPEHPVAQPASSCDDNSSLRTGPRQRLRWCFGNRCPEMLARARNPPIAPIELSGGLQARASKTNGRAPEVAQGHVAATP